MPKRTRKQREPFGRIRKLPSGRYQAGYIGPDLQLHHPTATFGTLMDARAWLTQERRHIDAGTWIAPNVRNRAQTPATRRRVHKIQPATLDELERIIAELPDRYALMVLLASWCALRYGELTELRRSDIDLKNGKIMVRRAVVRINGEHVVGTPKSSAGIRDVAIPPHLLPAVKQHLNDHAGWGRDRLLFPAPQSGGHLNSGSLHDTWDKARKAAGRPDLRFHDLRHTGAVLAAQSGATIAELMNRLGHSSPRMAINYQHVAEDRDTEIARRLSDMPKVDKTRRTLGLARNVL
jgi:integrase